MASKKLDKINDTGKRFAASLGRRCVRVSRGFREICLVKSQVPLTVSGKTVGGILDTVLSCAQPIQDADQVVPIRVRKTVI